ncbi:hypothetical protein J0910_17865 [Nocardiopsis sp. CNT-189]|uniref:ARPP-2 domain-containing protein n=1 Tax=Nocardiopsis oceanisediminis TaxID=2816862 RepID=UPI003B33A549
MTAIDTTGLHTGTAQVRGAVRLVPLLRPAPVHGLRLHPALTGADAAVVGAGRSPRYTAFVPHAYVASWDGDEGPSAAYGTRLSAAGDGAEAQPPPRVRVARLRRQVQRTARSRLRFLPLHLAMEGLLSLHFGGPDTAWQEWSRDTLRRGLSPREEASYLGLSVPGMAEALRTFEIVPGQCGVALYVGDELASVFAVPHPEDYRLLHPTLVLDMFGEAVYRNALFAGTPPDLYAPLRTRGVTGLAGLRAALAEQRASWTAFHDGAMLAPLTDPEYAFTRVYRLGGFTLWRFLPPFDPARANHIGEAVTDAEGRTAYLKTFALSAAQTRRGYLISRLAAADWRLDGAAAGLGTDRRGLISRLERAGLEHLLRRDVLDRYRAGRTAP